MKQLTIRGFSGELERRIRHVARTEGISLNQAVLRLLQRGAGLAHAQGEVIGSSLDHLIGTWSRKDVREFKKALAPLERIDRELWD